MFEWRYLFHDAILQRGTNIPRSAIELVSVDENGLTATVVGTNQYIVTIDNDFSVMNCSCPCGFNCKHMVAVLAECERHHNDEIAGFYAKSAVSKLAMAALNNKLIATEKRLEIERKEAVRIRKEAEKAERQRQWELDAPRRAAEKAERERLAEIRRIEKEKRDAEAKKKREERERIRAEKEKAEAEKRAKEKAEEERRRKEWQLQAEKMAKREAERQAIAEVLAAERAEAERQDHLDKEARAGIRALSKKDKEKFYAGLREVDERIAALERAECQEPYPEIDEELARLLALDERGWLYGDNDSVEGVVYRDQYHKEYFVPDGFRPWFSDNDGYEHELIIPKIEVGEGLDDEDDEDDE